MTVVRARAPLVVLAGALLAAAALAASAQPVTELSDPAAPEVSRFAADVARIDAELRARALVVDDPRGRFIAAHFDATDPAAQVRHLAAARVAAPQEPLYLAALAIACQQPVQPSLPECDAVDRLADWATRDVDNGVPLLLLAAKAARRGGGDTATAYLVQAAEKPRMDDYVPRGALAFWDYVMALPGDFDPAARAEAAALYAAELPRVIPTALAVACAATQLADARRSACAGAGAALAARATTFSARAAGAAVAERAAPDAAASAAVRARQAQNDALRARCAGLDLDARQSAQANDPALRARAVAAWDASVRAGAALGEPAACARRAGT